MHRLGLLAALCKSANPEIKHTINLNKNIKNSQNQKLKSLCVHTCWSFSSPAQQSANSCTPCLSLISILKTNILKNTPHKTLLEELGVVSRYQRGCAGAGAPETWLCTSRASSLCLLLPRNGSAGEERRQEIAWEWLLVLLPALPDMAGCEMGCKHCLSHYFLFHPSQNQEAPARRFAGKAQRKMKHKI